MGVRGGGAGGAPPFCVLPGDVLFVSDPLASVSDLLAPGSDPLASVGDPLASVGGSLASVSDPLVFVGDTLVLASDTLAFVGGSLVFVSDTLAFRIASLGSGGDLWVAVGHGGNSVPTQRS